MTQTRPARRPRQKRSRWNATDLGLIAVFAALVAASALVAAIPVGGLGVPITLQTLAVMLTGLALGPGRAFAAVGLYTLLGLAGLPIFSGGRSGLGILAGPSAGYIIGFPLAAAAVGWLAAIVIRRTLKYRGVFLFAAAMVTSIVVVHALGVARHDGQRQAGPVQGLPCRPPLLPGRHHQERPRRHGGAGPAQGLSGPAVRRVRPLGSPSASSAAAPRSLQPEPPGSSRAPFPSAPWVSGWPSRPPGPQGAAQDVTLSLTERRIGVIGANGSGKSTLLRLLNGLVAPTEGTVTVNGLDTVRKVRAVRQQVGFVFTDPLSQLVMPTGQGGR